MREHAKSIEKKKARVIWSRGKCIQMFTVRSSQIRPHWRRDTKLVFSREKRKKSFLQLQSATQSNAAFTFQKSYLSCNCWR